MSDRLGKIKAGREGELARGQQANAARGEEKRDKKKKTQIRETGTKAPSAGGRSVLRERGRGKTKQPTCSSGTSTTGGSSGSEGEAFSNGKLRLSASTRGVKNKGKSAKADHQQRPELPSLSGQEETDSGSDFEEAPAEQAAEDSSGEHESEHGSGSSEGVDDEEEGTNEGMTEEEEGQSNDEEDNEELSEDFEDDVETEEAEARGIDIDTKFCSMRGRGLATVLSVSGTAKTASPCSPDSPVTNSGEDGERTRSDGRNVLKPSLRGSGSAGGTERDRKVGPKPLLLTGGVADRRLATKGIKENEDRGDEGKPPSRKEEGKGLEKTRLPRFERLLEVPNPNEGPDDLLSDDDEEDNRIGNVPLWWYEKYDHIGYDKDGQKMIKQLSSSAIDQLLAKDDPEGWRTVVDVKNNRKYRLTDTDLEIIRRIRSGAFPSSSYDEEEVLVESDLEDSIFPMHNKPVPKHRFLPSKHEQKKITHLIHLVRSGQLLRDAEARRKKEGPEVFDLWGSSVYVDRREGKSKGHGPPPLPAPKLALPGHAESYNPPEEFLFTEEEKREWEAMAPEDRPLTFLPQKFAALRHVGAYKNLLLERFGRCLDLYLCPRSLKMAMNVDPASLLPQLPSPNDLRPFPTQRRVDYLPVTAYYQMQPVALPLITLGRRGLRVPRAGASSSIEGAREASAASVVGGTAEPCKRSRGLSAVCIDHTGQWVAVGGDDCVLRICELTTGKAFLSFKLQQTVTAAAFHPRLPILAVAVEDQLVFLVLDLPLFDKTAFSQAVSPKRKRTDDRDHEKTVREDGNENGGDPEAQRRSQLLEAKELLTLSEGLPEEEEDGEEEDGAVEQKRRQQTLKGVGVWRKIDTQVARAPADAGAVHGAKSRARGVSVETNARAWQATARAVNNTYEGDQPSEDDSVVSAPLGGVLCGLSILHDSTIRSIAWHRKGGYLIAMCPGSASPSQQCSVHSLLKKKTIHPIRRATGGHLKAAVFHPLKPWLVVAYHAGIRIFDLRNNKKVGPQGGKPQALLRKLIGAEAISSLDVHTSGEQVIAGGENRRLYVFDLELSSRVYKILRTHAGAITHARFHPSFPLMCTASTDGTVQVYHFKVFNDLMTNPLIVPVRKLRVVEDPKKDGGVHACMWHPTLPWLVTADNAGACSLWT